MSKSSIAAITFLLILSFLTACVHGTSPKEEPDEIKGLSNRRDVNHYYLDQSEEAEAYADQLQSYLGTVQSQLSLLGDHIEAGKLESAATLNEQLIEKGFIEEDIAPPKPFTSLTDLHHSYLVSLQELQKAIEDETYQDEQIHYGYAMLTIKLFSREFESLIADYGIKSEKATNP